MSAPAIQTDSLSERAPLAVWRAFSFRLACLSIMSIGLALPLVMFTQTPDGSDPFYVAVAMQFAIWGLIDLVFALLGLRETSRILRMPADTRSDHARTRAESLLSLLRKSRWQNAMWITSGVALLIVGYAIWSPSWAGHGVGVIVQAALLVWFDARFYESLSRACRKSEA